MNDPLSYAGVIGVNVFVMLQRHLDFYTSNPISQLVSAIITDVEFYVRVFYLKMIPTAEVLNRGTADVTLVVGYRFSLFAHFLTFFCRLWLITKTTLSAAISTHNPTTLLKMVTNPQSALKMLATTIAPTRNLKLFLAYSHQHRTPISMINVPTTKNSTVGLNISGLFTAHVPFATKE
jgi:hypothetical protein